MVPAAISPANARTANSTTAVDTMINHMRPKYSTWKYPPSDTKDTSVPANIATSSGGHISSNCANCPSSICW